MKAFRRSMAGIGIPGWVAVMFLAGVPAAALLGDDVKEVRYGLIQGRQPAEISKGLFGLGTKPGMAYTIKLVRSSEHLEVDSTNVSFLAGDCVAVAGEGDKTTLARAEYTLCGGRATAGSPGLLRDSGLSAHGPMSDPCAHARKESNLWPQGLGRNRALLRELMVCGQPSGTMGLTDHPERRACAQAWAEVERLPFGPERATARDHARDVCRKML